LSAFASPLVKGAIFVETVDINRTLLSVDTIQYCDTKTIPIKLVPIEKCRQLLTALRYPIAGVGEWVRFRKGRYKGDVGYVKTVNPTTLEYQVYYAPRLNLTSHRTEHDRPPIKLFDPVEVRNKRGINSVKEINDGFQHRNFFYEYGLRCDLVPYDAVLPGSQLPCYEELAPFASAGLISFEQVTDAVDKITIRLVKQCDLVRVFAGKFTGLVGIVSDMQDTSFIRVTIDYSSGRFEDVEAKYVNSIYMVGDMVKVTVGEDEGSVGWITDIDNDLNLLIFDKTAEEIV